MRLRFLGVRGSIPIHSSEVLEFGGNTTSFEISFVNEEFRLFIDGGTGLAQYSYRDKFDPSILKYHFLITHTHWDHILGFPFFLPYQNEKNEFTFHASETSKSTFSQLLLGLKNQVHLPVPLEQLKSQLKFRSLQPNQCFTIEEKVKVETYQLNHQGVTLGYRLQYNKDSVAIITDTAPIENGNYLGENFPDNKDEDFEKRYNEGLINFIKNCHTVVFDTHFTEKTLKPDWGHSTPEIALDFCIKANVKRLFLFHHAPEDDEQMTRSKVSNLTKRAAKYNIEVHAAKEGEVWDLS